jgi:uncharacterized membrane protein
MKPFTTLAVVVFAVVAVLQLVRVVAGWPVLIDGFAVPISASVVACAAATLLSVMLWREHRK